MDESWKFDLERWLAPFLSVFGHKTRARICPVYVAGLIGAGDRKSVQPGTATSATTSFITSSPARRGTPHRLRRSYLPKPTGWLVALRPG